MAIYAKGHVRAYNKDHLIQLSHRRHKLTLRGLKVTEPPSIWDSRTHGWVGPIKDQNSCGSCWIFSGTGVVEIAYNKAGVGGGASKMILSEQYTLSCGKNGGCNGDDNVTVLDWAKSTGLPLTSDYGPYAGSSRPGCLFKSNMKLFKVDDWGFADSNGGNGVTSIANIKAAIMAYGCVGAGIAADDAFMNISPGTVFDQTTSTDIDHDIIIIGWDDSKGKNGVWVVRNSWGTGWADGGYCCIGYGVNNVGTEAVFAQVNPSSPPVDVLQWDV